MNKSVASTMGTLLVMQLMSITQPKEGMDKTRVYNGRNGRNRPSSDVPYQRMMKFRDLNSPAGENVIVFLHGNSLNTQMFASNITSRDDGTWSK